ncbi:MAG: hypothetical protein PHE83_05730 [Opitutaceae bacterium]|nr:hypothetical protein [Opitutaceae bacterium]
MEETVTDPMTAKYTPGQHDVIAQLRQIQEELKFSDSVFTTKHLTVSSTTWYRIKNGSYAADINAAVLKLERDLRNYRLECAQAQRLTGGRPFIALPSQGAVLDAVTICKLKPADDPQRLVVYLADTGGGKTALGRQLQIQHNGVFVEGRESWRRSYLAALCDIALAAGVREVASLRAKGEWEVEQALFARLNANRRVLIIDEGEYFGPRTINLVKEVLNFTPTVVVILAIPALFNWWQRKSWEQAQQINRRGEAILPADPVDADDVAKFLRAEKVTLSGDMKSCCAEIAAAANTFGLYDMVLRIAKILREEYDAQAGAAEVRQAIAAAKRLLNRRF